MEHSLIIPARYESSRLPGKPLVQLCGKPMIVRTYERCAAACEPERVYVATDDARVESVCREHGIQVIMTSVTCLTGTDRVAECARVLGSELFINVQGDEPLFDPADIRALIEAARADPHVVMNGYAPIRSEEEYRSRGVPKLVMRQDERLLYMSRAPIPGEKSGGFTRSWRQICAYAFPRVALEAFAACESKTPLEELEDIEILRFLELGFEVQMLAMSDGSIPVDDPEDVKRVEEALRARGLA